MDEALKYLSLITACGAGISFVIGLFKWIDQRNREQEQKTYEAFHRMVCIAAIYQLQAYKQYAFASIPVLQLMQFDYGSQKDPRSSHMEIALRKTIEVLSEHQPFH
jgi:hypothetical protein